LCSIGDDTRFAATRARQDEHRPIRGFDGLALLRVEFIEKRQEVKRLQKLVILILQD